MRLQVQSANPKNAPGTQVHQTSTKSCPLASLRTQPHRKAAKATWARCWQPSQELPQRYPGRDRSMAPPATCQELPAADTDPIQMQPRPVPSRQTPQTTMTSCRKESHGCPRRAPAPTRQQWPKKCTTSARPHARTTGEGIAPESAGGPSGLHPQHIKGGAIPG